MKKLFNYISLFIVTVALMLINMNVSKAIDMGGPNDCGDLDSVNCRIINGEKIIANPNGFNRLPELGFDKVTKASRTYTVYYTYWKNFFWYGSDKIKHAAGYEKYYLNDDNEIQLFKNVDLFCLQAQLLGFGKDYKLGVERFLIDPHEGDQVSAYDVAMVSILSQNSEDYPNLNSDDIYQAKKMAARAIHFIWEFDSYPTSDSGLWFVEQFQSFYLYWNSARKWIENSSRAFDSLKKAAEGKFSVNNLENYRIINGQNVCMGNCVAYHYGGDDFTRVNNVAQEFFYKALYAAANYLNNLKNSSKITKNTQDVSEVVVSGSENNQLLTREYPIKFTIYNLKDENNNEFVINGIKEDHIPSDVTAEITKIKIGDRELDRTYLGRNLIHLLNRDGNTEVEVIIKISGYKNNLDCTDSQIKFSLDGYYSNTEFGKYAKYTGIVWWIDNANAPGNSQNYQRYVSLVNSNNSNPKNYLTDLGTFTTSLIERCSCTELLDRCENDASSDACEDLKNHKENCSCEYLDYVCTIQYSSDECEDAMDQYGEACSSCSSTISTVSTCCSKADDKLLVSNTLDDYQEPYTILGIGGKNMKACFVSPVDMQYKSDNDVGVEDQKGNTYTVEKNSYCAISCTEDYNILLPKAKLTQAGRYFTFDVRIEGTKICTTNTIDKAKYEEDIKNAQDEMITAYNTWLRYSKALEGIKDDNNWTRYKKTCETKCGDSYYDYEYNWSGGNYGYNGAYLNPYSATTEGSSGATSCKNGTSYCHYPTGSDSNNYRLACPYSSELNNCLNSARKWFRTNCDGVSGTCEVRDDGFAYSGGSKIQSSYAHGCADYAYFCNYEDEICSSSCHDGDKGVVETNLERLETDARHSLEEAQNKYKKILDDYKFCTDTSKWDFKDIKLEPDVTYDYDDNYFNLLNPRIGTMHTYTIDPKNTIGSATDNYDSTWSTTFATERKNYTYCSSARGCYTESYNIRTNKYFKTESTITSVYRPEEVFYNDYSDRGDILVGDDSSNDSSTVVDGLPVGRNSESGIHDYHVYVTNLGEFYDTGQLGKYFNSSNSSNSVFDLKRLEYDCSYLVNVTFDVAKDLVCTPPDGTCTEHCPPICIGPNCDDPCTDEENCPHPCIGIGCLYEKYSSTAYFDNQVSLKNMFPNGTNAYNWTNEKGKYTKNIIENKYVEGQTGDDGDAVFETTPVLSVTLDPRARSAIRDYNIAQESNGGYYNRTLTCKSLLSGGSDRLACYSSFITDLINGKYSAVVNNSTVINKRNIDNPRNGYFETWRGGNVIDIDAMIGPAWK